MLQANPALTPNQVKAILQFTAERRDGYDALTEGAGFLNARGAVELAQSVVSGSLGPALTAAGPISATLDNAPEWSRRIIWGNQRVGGGDLKAGANAWRLDVTWGSAVTPEGARIAWGVSDNRESDNIVWGTAAQGESDNIVWGTDCGGNDCHNIVWGTARSEGESDNIVWGTAREGDNIVWGTVRGEGESDNIVWGTNLLPEAEDVAWRAPALRRQSLVLTVVDASFR